MRLSVLVFALGCVSTALAQEPVSVDDTNPSIVYAPAGAWTVLTNEDPALQLYQNSTRYSSTIGATITWKFKGSHIEYWSDIGPNHGRCQITINGRDNGTVATFGDFGLPMRHFQRSGLNPESEQTIVITVVGADDSGMMGNVCSIDRFVYIPGDTASATSSGTSASTPSPNGGGSVKPTKSSSSSGVIGGVVGGVVGGLIAAFALFFWLRRRRQRSRESIEGNTEQPSTANEQGGNSVSHMSENYRPDPAPVRQIAAAAAITSPSGAPAISRSEKRTVLSAETPTSGGGSGSSESGTSSSVSRPLVQHLDAGGVVVPEPSGTGSEDLPPVYDDQWQRGQHR